MGVSRSEGQKRFFYPIWTENGSSVVVSDANSSARGVMEEGKTQNGIRWNEMDCMLMQMMVGMSFGELLPWCDLTDVCFFFSLFLLLFPLSPVSSSSNSCCYWTE